MLQCQHTQELYNHCATLSNTFTREQGNFMGQIDTHHITQESNSRIAEHVTASSIHKHTDILAYGFDPLAVT